MKFRIRLRILPVLVLVSMLSFAVRVTELWSGISHMGEASAQEKVQANPPPLPADAKKVGEPDLPSIATAADKPYAASTVTKDASKAADSTKTDTAKADPTKVPGDTGSGNGQKTSWKDATEEQYSCSDTQTQLNQDLAKRREDLDRQTREMATRQALLVAAQHELDQKVTEMTNLRNEIQGMMGQLTEQEKARIESLVKIYENMKPADAARIFDTLDTDVLISVMSQMKEAKSAPVLAAMNSDRAKMVTVMLAQQKKLPDLPPANGDAGAPAAPPK